MCAFSSSSPPHAGRSPARVFASTARLAGPGIVEYPHPTIAVRPGQGLRCDAFGNRVLELGP